MPYPSTEPSPPASVLVTGGAGFIGRSLCAVLARSGARVVALDDLSSGDGVAFDREAGCSGPVRPLLEVGDATRRDTLLRLLHERGPFDVLVHLAARVGVATVLADPSRCRAEHEAAAGALVDVLRALPRARRPRLIAASTSEVYAEKSGPMRECDPLRSTAGAGRWHYAGSKLHCERTFDAAAGLWAAGEGPVHLRFFNVVGPGQDADSGMVLPTFVRQALAGAPLTVHGDGADVRSLAHVADVTSAVADLVLRSAPGGAGCAPGPLNLGGTARTTTRALAELVVRLASSRSPVVLVDPRSSLAGFEAVRHREPCLERAHALGLRIRTRTLEELVSETVAAACAGGSGPLLASHSA